MENLQKTALFLTIVGAINWLLVGVFEYNFVAAMFGGDATFLAKIIYILIGISGLINIGLLFYHFEDRKKGLH